ncbi:MAG: FHA domain-containing protein, partial [Ktedonobacterales bacterium]
IRKVPGMVVCPWCGKSSNSTTYCVSCGAKLDTTTGGAEPESTSPAFAAFVAAIHSEWPDLQLDDGASPLDKLETQPPHMAVHPPQPVSELPEQVVSPEPGHVLVRLKASETGGSGDLSEYIVELSGQDVIIGRLPTCEICLDDDPLVSRYHANLSFRDGVYVLADMGSSNGTYLNDEAVTEDTILQVGDEVSVGIHEILIRSGHNFPEYLRKSAHHHEKSSVPAPSAESTDPGLAAVDAAIIATYPAEESPNRSSGLAGPTEPTGDPVSLGAVTAPSPPAPLLVQGSADLSQHDLSALQSQLEGIARVLGQQAAEDARVARELRSSLESAHATLANLLATELEPMMSLFSPDLGELIQAAQQAAENPRHVDYVTALATRAGTIATTLAALQRLQSQSGILASLRELYAELDAALA